MRKVASDLGEFYNDDSVFRRSFVASDLDLQNNVD